MTYEDIAEDFKEGRKVRRESWNNFDHIFLGMNSYGNQAVCDAMGYTTTLTTDDLLADDWEIVEE